MRLHRYCESILIFSTVFLLWTCRQDSQWKGQEPIRKVSTLTVPIQLQHKGIYDLAQGVFCSNDFEGARLNGVARTNDTLITALITPENEPINESPWYAFKIWSQTERQLYLKLTYPEQVHHRYYPKLSRDGRLWQNLDSVNYLLTLDIIDVDTKEPIEATMRLSIGPDTLWVSAQELITSLQVDKWMNMLDSNTFVTKIKIGASREGRAINALKIGESDDQQMVIILSRQHPPEITGYLAMTSFVETICADSELAAEFRKKYNTYVVPMANPDGAHHGHWRHNSGGVDLNRDWEDFNQPETVAIRDFLRQKTKTTGGKFYFGIDFHSTWEDIYYTIGPELRGNMPGLVPDMIAASAQELPGYVPNIQPRSDMDANVSSAPYLFYEYGAESLTYEVGDNTPREFILEKAAVTAVKLMELMMK